MCIKVNMDFKEWLRMKYIDEQKTVRELAILVYDNIKDTTSIISFLKRYKIEARHGGEAIKVQWNDNDKRREQNRQLANKNLQTKESREKLKQVQQTKEYKLKSSMCKMGNKNGMYGIVGSINAKWNPNLTDESRIKNRRTFKNMRWRKAIIKKFNSSCAICKRELTSMYVHHLNGYTAFPAERFDINNGVCLCEDCHIAFHKAYGFGDNTKEQFRDWESTT